MAPGTTWTETQEITAFHEAIEPPLPPRSRLPEGFVGKVQAHPQRVLLTYEYLGSRERRGRREAVLRASGTVSSDGGTLSAQAVILIDEDTAVMTDADWTIHTDLLSRSAGQPRRIMTREQFKLRRELLE
jgi:hypothetical protein